MPIARSSFTARTSGTKAGSFSISLTPPSDRQIDQLNRLLNKLPKKLIVKATGRAFRKAARPLIADIKARAPVQAYTGIAGGAFEGKVVHTKTLRRSIKSRIKKDRRTGAPIYKIGAIASDRLDPFYARFVEAGTARARAKPFLQPAFDAHHANIMNAFVIELRKQIAKIARDARSRRVK